MVQIGLTLLAQRSNKTMVANECTIVYTWYNTPELVWLPSLDSALKTNLPILIVDDQSTPDNLERLKRSISNIGRVKLVVPNEKLYQVGCTHLGASHINTKYMIRMDSDDIILSMPKIPNHQSWDIIHGRMIQSTSLDNLLEGYRANLNGSIVKTEIFKELYSDWEMFNAYNYEYHEDLWYGFKLMFLFKDLQFIKAKERHYMAVMQGVSELVPKRTRLGQRVETIREVMKIYKLGSPDRFFELIKSNIKSQKEIFKTLNN